MHRNLGIHNGRRKKTCNSSGLSPKCTNSNVNGWPSTRAEAKEEMQMCWTFHDDMAVIEDIVMKDRRIVVPALLQKEPLSSYN